MKRVVKYVAKDGVEFDSVDNCAEHDRRVKFTSALTHFLTDKFPSVDLEELSKLDRVWDVIYKNPASFLSVVESAIEPPRRGRPRKDKNIEETPAEKPQIQKITVEPVANSDTPTPVVSKKFNVATNPWRGYVGPPITSKVQSNV